MRLRGLFQFNLQIRCREKLVCSPIAKFSFREGRLLEIRLEFNTDPSAGCVPFDFNWEEFDSFAAQCRALTSVTMVIDEGREYTARFYTGISVQMKYTHEAGRLQIQYWPEGSKGRQTWTPDLETGDEGQTSQ